MYTRVLALRFASRWESTDRARLVAVTLTGTAVAIVGLLGFVTVHSLVITPIWSRFGSGIVQALLAGITQAWAFESTFGRRDERSAAASVPSALRRPLRHGAAFGLIIFTTLIPATIFSNALRLMGVHANDWPGLVGSIALSLASGAAAGWLMTRERSGIMIYMAAAFGLVLASAGPIPVVNSVRAASLFAGLLPVCVIAGVVLAAVRGRL